MVDKTGLLPVPDPQIPSKWNRSVTGILHPSAKERKRNCRIFFGLPLVVTGCLSARLERLEAICGETALNLVCSCYGWGHRSKGDEMSFICNRLGHGTGISSSS